MAAAQKRRRVRKRIGNARADPWRQRLIVDRAEAEAAAAQFSDEYREVVEQAERWFRRKGQPAEPEPEAERIKLRNQFVVARFDTLRRANPRATLKALYDQVNAEAISADLQQAALSARQLRDIIPATLRKKRR